MSVIYIEVICTLDVAAIAAEMELHSKVARLCLQTAKRPGEGERAREGWNREDAKARQVYGLRSRLLSLPLVERYTDAGEASSSTYHILSS